MIFVAFPNKVVHILLSFLDLKTTHIRRYRGVSVYDRPSRFANLRRGASFCHLHSTHVMWPTLILVIVDPHQLILQLMVITREDVQ